MNTPTLPAADRKVEQEMVILTEIGQILSSTLNLRDAFLKSMQVLIDKMDMLRGALVLLDETSGRLHTEAAVGLRPDEIERGVYALGEGITGSVVVTGRPRVISDIRAEPDFLNRTAIRNLEPLAPQISFFCIPVKVEGRAVGALSCDKAFVSDEQVHHDTAFLGIVATFLAQ